jgi:ubiquinone/menaquinone biosynthesis C-methylase UbiE
VTLAAYDAIAEWYDQTIRATDPVGDLVLPALFALVGDVRGQHICDLACGQGRLSRLLAEQKAQVTGVDLSSELIKIAQRDEANEPLGIHYLVNDAMTLGSLGDGTFDGVVCNMALMDIPDLDAVFKSVWRILHPQGWFVFSITHPCFSSPHADWQTAEDGTVSRVIHSYFSEAFWRSTYAKGVRGQVGAYHRTLSTYLNTLRQNGFHFEQMIEPKHAQASTEHHPGYHVVPAFLVIKGMKTGR